MTTLLHPTYFPNIAHCIAISNTEHLVFEACDNYQKQTYRNRTSIYSANGKLTLSIPVRYTQNNRQLFNAVEIANNGKWQAEHWKSIISAYSTSPFFEYYRDDLEPLFKEEVTHVMPFNLKCFNAILNCLQLDLNYQLTELYESQPEHCLDLRHLVDPKHNMTCINYTQVFENKHGFINNLSILDLLFNEGPNTLNYLQQHSLDTLKANSI